MSEIIENSLEELLLLFNYSADLPRCGIASCRSSPTIMGNTPTIMGNSLD